MFVNRALVIAVAMFAVVTSACSDDEKTETPSGGTSGTSGTPSASGSSQDDSGAPTTGTNCSSVSTCNGALCTCVAGPNKDKQCQKVSRDQTAYCDTLCEACK